jgi:hypothetical protein
VSGLGFVAGVVALFFACGILMGVLAVMALSARRDRRGRAVRRRYDQDQADTLDWPRRPSGPDWEARPGWDERRGSDETDESPPPWPGGCRVLTIRSD